MTTQASTPTYDLTVLRLYFPANSRAKATRFWHRLGAPALAQHLLEVARRSGIQQALLYPIGSGYLPGERLTHHHLEGHALRHRNVWSCLTLKLGFGPSCRSTRRSWARCGPFFSLASFQ